MRESHSTEALDQLVARWRAAGGGDDSEERLSAATRARILGLASARESGLPPLGWLFFPAARFALAGALPVVLLSLALSYLGWDGMRGAAIASHAGTTIQATVDGDRVVFVIANGSRVHRVYKSGTPNRFGEAPEFTTRDGSFVDRVHDGRDLVFYRID